MVPLGERALAWLNKYLVQARPELAVDTQAVDRQALFVNDYGEPAHADFISGKVKRYMEFAGVQKVGSAHLLRHACATHMLEGGADIRFIQEMLGHADLHTTEIYTHVSIDKLIAVHRQTHPSRLQRQRDGASTAGVSAVVSGPGLDLAQDAAAAALLLALQAEGEQDEAGPGERG